MTIAIDDEMLAPENDAPAMDDLIAGAISDDTHKGGNDALDGLTLRLSGTVDDNAAPLRVDGAKRRGRPVGSVNTRTKTERQSKAQLQEAYDKLAAELATERARNNDAAVSRLADQVEMLSYLAFGFAAKSRGAHWAMTAPEAKDIGKTGALALAPHADVIQRYAPWTMLAATIGGAIYNRVQEDERLIALHGVAVPVNG